MTRFVVVIQSCCRVFVGRPLWQEDQARYRKLFPLIVVYAIAAVYTLERLYTWPFVSTLKGKVKVKSIIRSMVNWPLCLSVRHPAGTPDQFFSLLKLFLDSYEFDNVVRPLWWEVGVCSFQLKLGIASADSLGSESRMTNDNILLPQFLRLPQPVEPGSCIYFPQEEGSPVIPPGVKLSQIKVKVKVTLRPTASRPVRHGVRHPFGTRDQFFPFYLWLYFRQFGFVVVGRPLWREVGSVDLSPTGFMSIFYCIYFWDSPNLEGQIPVFISPRNRVAQLYPRTLGSSN
jgi:hypothetical protein